MTPTTWVITIGVWALGAICAAFRAYAHGRDRERERCATIAEGQRRGMGSDTGPFPYLLSNRTCNEIAAKIRGGE